jgi:hypothetical protein
MEHSNAQGAPCARLAFEFAFGEQTHFEGFEGAFQLVGMVVRADNGEMLAVASLESNLYQLDTNVVNGAKMSSLAHFDGNLYSLELWHKRLGHLNANSVKTLQSMVSGMDVQTVPKDVHSFTCEGCIQSK